MNTRKVVTIVIPLFIGGSILFTLLKISEPKSGTPAATTTTVPQNAAHEKASLEEQLQKNPGHPPILLRLAEIASTEGNATAAINYLKQAVATDPKNADARLELGRALYDTGDSAGALRETQQLIADHPENVDGLYNLGAIYANQNQFDQAKQYWLKAAALDPNSDSGKKAQSALGQIK